MKILNLLDIFVKKMLELFLKSTEIFRFIYRMILQNNTENLSMADFSVFIMHFLFSQILDYSPEEIFSVCICCLDCCTYSLRCYLEWHIMKRIVLCAGCCCNCHQFLVRHFCDSPVLLMSQAVPVRYTQSMISSSSSAGIFSSTSCVIVPNATFSP